jgi:predicted nucleotidyltransferase
MKPSEILERHRDAIRRIVAAHHATNVRVFGSVAEDLDREDSDLDLLVDITPRTTLMDIGAIRLELKALLQLEVDVVTPGDLPARDLSAALFRLEASRGPAEVLEVLKALIEWLGAPEQAGLRQAFTVWLKRVFLPKRLPGVDFEVIRAPATTASGAQAIWR